MMYRTLRIGHARASALNTISNVVTNAIAVACRKIGVAAWLLGQSDFAQLQVGESNSRWALHAEKTLSISSQCVPDCYE